jgi:hypothetical protein
MHTCYTACLVWAKALCLANHVQRTHEGITAGRQQKLWLRTLLGLQHDGRQLWEFDGRVPSSRDGSGQHIIGQADVADAREGASCTPL